MGLALVISLHQMSTFRYMKIRAQRTQAACGMFLERRRGRLQILVCRPLKSMIFTTLLQEEGQRQG